MEKGNKAFEYYELGYNCSQSVLATYSEDLGISEDTALKISSGFAGGVGEGEVCGAVIGAVMVLGLKYGHITSEIPIDNVVGEFKKEFKDKNNTLLCKEILGYDLSKKEDFEKVVEKDLFNTVCPKVVGDAVSILEKIINQ